MSETQASVDWHVDLFWIPLGAGTHSVRLNGVIYEALTALIQRRPRRDIYHSALQIWTDTGLYTVEMTPVPDSRNATRGVVGEGAVGAKWARRLRVFRYEVRRWRNGVIPDQLYAASPPVRLTDDPAAVSRIFGALSSVPTPTWGRDELRTGEMWTCNSVISWALEHAGLDADEVPLPEHGRAPGWKAGVALARRRSIVEVP
ncbi:MAG: hypothetical protein QOK28_1530 [Actinomycetota bacterium]